MVNETIQLVGTTSDGKPAAHLLEQQGQEAGSLTINSMLLIQDGAQATVSSLREGVTGDLGITANSVRLDNGKITAETRSGNGGNLMLNIADLLLMRRGSQISTTAGTAPHGSPETKTLILMRPMA
ncbi:hypothetical protein AB0758_00065 [Tolypothrix bouteillei VB521301_2]|uniref:hypothetical protein n=1 Tax=Tolypothrix bouteillei TaxID=1246981 RepID=UPI0038B64B31